MNALRFSEGTLPFRYLGVPIVGRDLRSADCIDLSHMEVRYNSRIGFCILVSGVVPTYWSVKDCHKYNLQLYLRRWKRYGLGMDGIT